MTDPYWGGAILRCSVLVGGIRCTNLRRADLRDATLNDVNPRYANLSGVKANSRTTCPDGKKWRTAGRDCPF